MLFKHNLNGPKEAFIIGMKWTGLGRNLIYSTEGAGPASLAVARVDVHDVVGPDSDKSNVRASRAVAARSVTRVMK